MEKYVCHLFRNLKYNKTKLITLFKINKVVVWIYNLTPLNILFKFFTLILY